MMKSTNVYTVLAVVGFDQYLEMFCRVQSLAELCRHVTIVLNHTHMLNIGLQIIASQVHN